MRIPVGQEGSPVVLGHRVAQRRKSVELGSDPSGMVIICTFLSQCLKLYAVH